MKIVWQNGFALGPAESCDLLIAKESGFKFDSASASWLGDAAAVKTLRTNALRLSSPLTITELAVEHYKAAGATVMSIVELSRATDSDMIIPVPAGCELLPFQRAGVDYASKRERVLIADEMGLGKTVQAIATVNADHTAHQILVICPASLKTNWQREFKKWTTKFLDYQIVDGTEPAEFTHDVTIINYDILKAHREALHAMKWDVLIVDECHYLKKGQTDRTREVFGGIKRAPDPTPEDPYHKKIIDRVSPIPAKRVILMSGTPIVNKPKELWPLLQVIDPEGLGSDWHRYATRYCKAFKIDLGEGRAPAWKWDGADNLEELQEIMRSRFMVRRLKKDVLKELPAKRRQVIVLEPKTQLRKLVMKELKTYEEHTATLKAQDTPNELALEFVGLSALRKEIALKKVPYVVEHVKEILNEQPKVVIFGHHHEVLSAFEEAFKGCCVRVDGRVSLADRQVAVDTFQTDLACKVFIGGIQAAGVGLTLTAASVVVFSELTWVPGEISQAEDRLHRISQRNQVLVQHIVLEGSLDERMVEVLIAKQEIIDKALDNNEKV